jgi:pyrroloquinoline quinone biosynthesis protein B
MRATAILLGTAQDGGLPQVRCRCAHCEHARADPRRARRVACLGLVSADGRGFLVDATPDFPRQAEGIPSLDGILLTHAHLGHLAGLAFLGTEAMGARDMPVFCGPRLAGHLARHEPYASILAAGRILLREITPGVPVELAPGLSAEPVLVPHRAEWSETFAFRIRGPRRTLLWLPDVDRLTATSLRTFLRGVDLAFLDGTFWSADELPGRDIREVPHPFVTTTLDLLDRLSPRTAVSFIHLNHTNPLWNPRSAASAELRRRLDAAGLACAAGGPVAREGRRISL